MYTEPKQYNSMKNQSSINHWPDNLHKHLGSTDSNVTYTSAVESGSKSNGYYRRSSLTTLLPSQALPATLLLSWSTILLALGMLEVHAVISPYNSPCRTSIAMVASDPPHLWRLRTSRPRYLAWWQEAYFLLSSFTASCPSWWSSLILRSVSTYASASNMSPRFGPVKINDSSYPSRKISYFFIINI